MSFRFRRGDTASVTLKFNKSISDKDVMIAIFDAKRNIVKDDSGAEAKFISQATDTEPTRPSSNIVVFDIGYNFTKNMLGLYFLDILLKQGKSPTFTYVSSGNKPIEMFFEESLIAQTLENDTTGNNNN